MSGEHWSKAVPDAHRDAVVAAVEAASIGDVRAWGPVAGGASGALTYRADATEGSYLVRVETARDYFRNPQRSYACMLSAAKAGVAPPVHYTDVDAGVAVMDFIATRPLDSYPGGVDALIPALGRTIATLQTTDPFPVALSDFGDLISRVLDVVVQARVLRAGALATHLDALERIRSVYPWTESAQVSAHNDVNPFNVLFDGERLWLVDWELAFLNDPFADLAIIANNWADSVEREAALLASWLGAEPTPRDSARLTVMRQASCLFYAAIILSAFAGTVLDDDTPGFTPAELRQQIESGALAPGPELMLALGRTNLRAFADALSSEQYVEAMHLLGS